MFFSANTSAPPKNRLAVIKKILKFFFSLSLSPIQFEHQCPQSAMSRKQKNENESEYGNLYCQSGSSLAHMKSTQHWQMCATEPPNLENPTEK